MFTKRQFVHAFLLSVVVTASRSASVAATCGTVDANGTMHDWSLRGDCLREAGQPLDAIDAYQKGLIVNAKGSKDLYMGLGLAYRDTKQLQSALSAMESAVQFDPSDPESLLELGYTHEDLGNYPAAIDLFRKVVAVRPQDNRAQRNIGFVLLEMGDDEAGIPYLEKAIEIDPRDWKAHLNLGSAYLGICEDIDFVMNHPTELPIKSAEEGRARRARADRLPEYAALAKKHAREATELNPSEWVGWLNLGIILDKFPDRHTFREERAEAIQVYKRALEIRPGEYKLMRSLATAQKRAALPQDALETCRSMEKTFGGGDEWLMRTMGFLESQLELFDESARHYKAAIAINDSDGWYYFGLARAYHFLGRPEDEKAALARGRELAPDAANLSDEYLLKGI